MIANIPIRQNAKLLFENKRAMAKLKQEEKALKKKLEPFVKPSKPLELFDGQISQRIQKTRKWFNRTEVLEQIESSYGQEVADEIDYHCTRRTKTAKRLHVKLFDDKE